MIPTGARGRLLRCYAANRKVAVSSPDEVNEDSYLPNPSSSTMVLGFTELIAEISTRR
jgi:hypothetical protein